MLSNPLFSPTLIILSFFPSPRQFCSLQFLTKSPFTKGYPVVTIPAGINTLNGLPFGLALMNTAWSEPTLIRYASAIEDLQFSTNTKLKRTLPTWYGYREKNIPVL